MCEMDILRAVYEVCKRMEMERTENIAACPLYAESCSNVLKVSDQLLTLAADSWEINTVFKTSNGERP